MPSTNIDPAQMLNSYRKTDAVVIVCQNNSRKMMEIAALNQEASRLFGYSNEELRGQPLERLLPKNIAATLADLVEYDDNGNDLLQALSKINDFNVKTRLGQELPLRLRVIRGESIDHNPWFHLVFIDENKQRKSDAFRGMLKENFKGHEVLDQNTSLISRNSLIKDLELMMHYVRSGTVSGTFAIMDINNYERLLNVFGANICHHLHRHIGQTCKMKLRTEDTLGSLSDRSLGVILVDAPQDPARMVLNRLRWVVNTSPMQIKHNDKSEELVAEINIAFTQLDGKISEIEMLEKCESFINVMREKRMHNAIQLVVTHERRTKEDRRKVNIPVAVERRKSQRRKNPDGNSSI